MGEEKGAVGAGWGALALGVGTLLVALLSIHPPAPRPASAPATEFSAERAMVHVRAIAQQPRPVGSPAHARARGYISEELTRLGLRPEILPTTGIAELPLPFGATYRAAVTAQNIFARLPGRASGKALLLMAHYDSVPASPGASDNAAAVGALLETARALRASAQPLANDVIFLFTDGEEAGLIGSRGFFGQHPTSREVGAVLNFEARGNQGPVLMFETGPGSGWMLPELASAVPYTFASSLFDEVYRYLPNLTDFTLSKTAGIQGLNFAYIGSITAYHSALDSAENVDLGSVQHHGEYALRLARRLGERELGVASSTNRVFFNLVGSVLVYYPETWSIPLMLVVAAVWLGVVGWGMRRGHLRVGKVLVGAFVILLALVAVAVGVTLLTLLIEVTHGEYRRVGDAYNSVSYMVGFVLLTLAAMTALVLLLRTRVGVYSLAVGASLWWGVLMVLSAVHLPGASFLFTWPLLFFSLGLGLLLRMSASRPAAPRLLGALAVSSVPAILIVAPFVYLIFVGLTLRLSAAAVFVTGLLLGLLIPLLHELTAARRWWVPAVTALAGVAVVALASFPAVPTETRPRQNSVIYALDANSGHAIWASSDAQVDEWTRQFFTRDMREGLLPDFMPQWQREFRYAPAPVLSAPPPTLEVLADTLFAEGRTVRVRITSPRGARSAAVMVFGVPVLAYAVDGVAGPKEPDAWFAKIPFRDTGSEWALWLEEGPGSRGNEVSLTVPSGKAFTIRVLDRSEGLPDLPGFAMTPRSRGMMPAAALDVENWSNSTYLSKAFAMTAAPPTP